MSKQCLVCRFGVRDIAEANVAAPDSTSTTLLFTDPNEQFTHGIGKTLQEVRKRGITPSETAFDLLVLAASVYRSDTRIDRSVESQDNWTREIDVYLPVHDPERWNRVRTSLGETLEFLTGDKWRFFFRPRPEGFETIVTQSSTINSNLPNSACLFSGGLDSFIGAIDLLEAGENTLLIHHANPWDSGTNKYQKACLDALKAERDLQDVKSDIGFHKRAKTDPTENTERSRSFLFFAVAAFAASGLRQTDATIHVPENGLMSLNVPLDSLRLGSLSTRTTHPFYMGRFNELLRTLEIPAHVANPYRFKTKGHMVRECRNQAFLEAHVAKTMSCASPKKNRTRGMPYGHCGYCFPCLIRRASLFGFNDTTPYQTDLRQQPLISTKAEGDSVRSCQLAINKLNNDIRRARTLIHKPGPLGTNFDDLEAYAHVYLDGMQEIATLLNGVRTVPYALTAS